MKKWVVLILAYLIFLVTGVSDSLGAAAAVVEIKEKMFIAQCNDIYLNPEEYAGKTIRVEGMYDEYTDDAGTVFRAVVRNGPGCCGNDGVAGFEFSCEGVPDCKPNDWILVEGIISSNSDKNGYNTVTIENAALTVKAERGAEYVSQ